MNFLSAHAGFFGAAAVWILSAAISAMPDPDTTSSKGYRWLFGFLHGLAGNLDKLGTSIKPPIK